MRRRPLLAVTAALGLCCLCAPPLRADGISTNITPDRLDAAAYTEWVDGAERPIRPRDARDAAGLPAWVLWTSASAPGHAGIKFGDSKAPGPRFLRVGLREPTSVGAILVRGGVAVSVLKPGAAYPGDLADDSQWEPASRLRGGRVVRDEGDRNDYLLWTLLRPVTTRALRFTHVAAVTDKEYAGYLGGAYALPAPLANVAPQAVVSASANERGGLKVVDENADAPWEQWSNIPLAGGQRAGVVSPESPEWVVLSWPRPVTLRGIGTAFAGFAEADVQAYDGPADVHPREAPESAWKPVGRFAGLTNRYPVALGIDWLDFGRDVTSRAIRLRITRPMREGGHPHTQGHTRDGQRVWLGELFALSPVGDGGLATAILPAPQPPEHPPIAIPFTLPEAGYVTLVIEDSAGKRVRNLLADTSFEKGPNVAWWDGSDDLGRDPAAAAHGVYSVPSQLVAPGTYRARGLWHKRVDVRYEFGVYAAGTTPWETSDRSGGWLANHTPPSAVLFVPDAPTAAGRSPTMLIGSYVSEGTAGLAWVDLDGKKWRGQNWVGGNWTGAPYLARDAGPKRAADAYAYVAAAWSAGDNKTRPVKGEVRITGLTVKEDRAIAKVDFAPTMRPDGSADWQAQIGGLAAYDGVVVFSLPPLNKLVFVDARAGTSLGEAKLELPYGLAFDGGGALYAISGTRIVRYGAVREAGTLGEPAAFVAGLEEPRGITADARGNVYVSDRGQSHQVKVFAPDGKPLRTFGKPGAPAAGPYDPDHMNNPRGVCLDARGRLWVAEEDAQPKRVSVWNADGSLAAAYYGPAEYGGGGSIDPLDKSRFYYNGMEFRLDWKRGRDTLASVFYRPTPADLKLAFRSGPPQAAVYVGGRRYWTNAFNSSPTNGHGTAFVFADRDGRAVPVSAAGRANEWDVLKDDALAGAWPAGADRKAAASSDKAAFFVWSDRNGDGRVQADELVMERGACGGVTVGRDLAFLVSRLGTRALRIAPSGFTPAGVPAYGGPEVLAEGAQPPPSSGGAQVLVDGKWAVLTTAPKPFAASGIAGVRDGVPLWSYPSLWPGLHASHEAPVPDHRGEIIGHTRLLGDTIAPGGEPMFLLNGNTGAIYVFTTDGLFVTQLFQDMRLGRPWGMPIAARGMLLNEMTPSDENFWPSVTQAPDGAVYLVAGRPNCLVRVDGLETARRLPAVDVAVGEAELNGARDYVARAEAARQAARGRGVLNVAMRTTPPVVDGQLDDWAGAAWVDVDQRGTRAYFNSNSKPYDVTAAVAVAGERLYAAWRTGDKDLLHNAGDAPNALFKTGGALDLMIGADPAADPKRAGPVAGDVRLLVAQVGGKVRATLYRAVVPGTKEPVPFSSPGRTVSFDRVEDVSDQVALGAANGDYELSVPLALLGLRPGAGMVIAGDIGILRGTGSAVTQRVYWSNKATNIVADVPSEAELRPNLWGRWVFEAAR